MAGRAVVTGGAGFVGSHVCRRLVAEGWEVLCLDSLLSGSRDNVADLAEDRRFRFEHQDVTEEFAVAGAVEWVLHLASPASPVDYLRYPIETLRVGAIGTLRALEMAREKRARFLLASTSEVYGNPEVHPQPEGYTGNVDPVGPRSVYDEAKRYAEAASMAFHRTDGVAVRIARIFNTYGPRMRRDDGRAIPTFMAQALAGEAITVHGDGRQTRSLCYVDDLVEGLVRLIQSDLVGPVNLGNPEEVSVLRLAELVREAVGSSSDIVFTDRPEGDPDVRRPDISLARSRLGWEPGVPLLEGLSRTVTWARSAWTEVSPVAERREHP